MDGTSNVRRQSRLALALAAVAGFIDAVGYLTLHRLFTAHMSGNTARIGVDLGRGDLSAAVPLAVAVVLFVFGVGLGSAASELAMRRKVASTAALVLGIQAVLLVAFMVYGSTVVRDGHVVDHSLRGFYVLASLAILSIGLQASSLSQVGGHTVRTTYISGVLTSLAQESANALLPATRRGDGYLQGVLGLGPGSASRGRALLLLGISGMYFAGAVGGGFAQPHFSVWSLAFPLALLAVAAIADLRRPVQ